MTNARIRRVLIGAAAAAVLAAGVAGTLTAQLRAQQATPTFRAKADVVELDVSVLDKDHQPVKGLKQSDFTILEDGKPQEIVAFDSVELPDVVTSATPAAKWTREVSPDMTTNQIDNHRLVIIVMDDATIVQGKSTNPDSTVPCAPNGGPGRSSNSRQPVRCETKPVDMGAVRAVAHATDLAIDHLGPNDLATVMFTGDNAKPQDFTSDVAKLHAAAQRFNVQFSPTCEYFEHSIETLTTIADYLASVPNRRKALIFVSGGVPVDAGTGALLVMVPDAFPKACGKRLIDLRKDAFREAERSNVAVYTIDPFGLRPDANFGTPDGAAVEFMQTVAENTGGRAIVNTNDYGPGIDQIFRENSSYYLVGYTPANVKADGTFRRIDVKVNRPDVEVRTRKNYYAPDAKALAKDAAKPQAPADMKAMSSVLPNADVPLQVTAAPFFVAGSKNAAVAVALGIEQPSRGAPRADDVTATVRAFTPEGEARGSTVKQSVRLALSSSVDATLHYDVLSRIDLPPGTYELRISAHSGAVDKDGSVYADLVVPDFTKDPIALSGVLLNLSPSRNVAPGDALMPLLPVLPTSQRTFSRFARLSAFVRLYQTGKTTLAPIMLRTRVIDDKDVTAIDKTDTIATDRFDAASRAADQSFDVPLSRLVPGNYVLTLEATLGKTTARRDVRFTVK